MRSATIVFGSLILGAVLAPLQGQQYLISTFAGGGPPLPAPAPGLNISFGYAVNVAADSAGNVYIASYDFSSVFKLDQNGMLAQFAGNGRAGYSGDGGPATSAQLNRPLGVELDAAGNLFIVEWGHVRRVAPNGIITTVAGAGNRGFSGDGGPATDAQIAPGTLAPLAVDSAGELFLAESGNYRVRKVSTSGIISTVVGTGTQGFSGDGGPATAAQVYAPNAVAVDSTGNLFIADGSRVRKVSPDGIISTVAGTGSPTCCLAQALAVDRSGNLFFEDNSDRLQKLSTDGTISTVAGNGSLGYSGDAGPT